MAPVLHWAFCDALIKADRVVCGKAKNRGCFAGFSLSQNVQVNDTCAEPAEVIGD